MFKTNQRDIYIFDSDLFLYTRNLKKRTFKTGFWVKYHLLNLCSSAVDSQRLFCSQKAGEKECEGQNKKS